MANGAIARFVEGVWTSLTPKAGWTTDSADEGKRVRFDRVQWKLEGAPLEPWRNLLINGGFHVWHRGASLTNLSGAGVVAFGPVRWAPRQSDGPANALSRIREAGFTVVRIHRPAGSMASGVIRFGQILKAEDAGRLRGQWATFSMGVRAGANWSGSAAIVRLFTGTVADEGAHPGLLGQWANTRSPRKRRSHRGPPGRRRRFLAQSTPMSRNGAS